MLIMPSMPRKQRAKSNTGYYHVIARGNEQKNIFVDDENKNIKSGIEFILKKNGRDNRNQ